MTLKSPPRLEFVPPKHREILTQHSADPELCERLHKLSTHQLLAVKFEKFLLALKDYVPLASPTGRVARALTSLQLMSAENQDIMLQHTDEYDIGKMILEAEREIEAIGKGNLFLRGNAGATDVSGCIRQGQDDVNDKAVGRLDSAANGELDCGNSMPDDVTLLASGAALEDEEMEDGEVREVEHTPRRAYNRRGGNGKASSIRAGGSAGFSW